ncbi:MAG: hypothetical protein P8Y08_11050 [Desulfobulbaceae bacterium]
MEGFPGEEWRNVTGRRNGYLVGDAVTIEIFKNIGHGSSDLFIGGCPLS